MTLGDPGVAEDGKEPVDFKGAGRSEYPAGKLPDLILAYLESRYCRSGINDEGHFLKSWFN